MERLEVINGRVFRVILATPGVNRDIYSVERISGEWPSDLELINLCNKFNLGGTVSKRDDKAFVIVDTN
jgi:hypothetical protein